MVKGCGDHDVGGTYGEDLHSYGVQGWKEEQLQDQVSHVVETVAVGHVCVSKQDPG